VQKKIYINVVIPKKQTPGRNATGLISKNQSFSHPDYTVGFGISPNHAHKALAGYTAGRESHPAPKTIKSLLKLNISLYFSMGFVK